MKQLHNIDMQQNLIFIQFCIVVLILYKQKKFDIINLQPVVGTFIYLKFKKKIITSSADIRHHINAPSSITDCYCFTGLDKSTSSTPGASTKSQILDSGQFVCISKQPVALVYLYIEVARRPSVFVYRSSLSGQCVSKIAFFCLY